MQALEMRKKGESFPAIAKSLGYATMSGAYNAVMSAIKRTLQEPADEVRQLELARLDALLSAAWKAAMANDGDAQYRVLAIMARRAKLLGLDAPTKIAPTDPTGEHGYCNLSDDQLSAIASRGGLGAAKAPESTPEPD